MTFSGAKANQWCKFVGSPRVEGDDDEDDTDDLDNEFDYGNLDSFRPHSADASFVSRLNTSRGSHRNASHMNGQSEHEPSRLGSEISLLTYGEEVIGVLQLYDVNFRYSQSNRYNDAFSCARITRFLLINMLLYPILWVVETETIRCRTPIHRYLVSRHQDGYFYCV